MRSKPTLIVPIINNSLADEGVADEDLLAWLKSYHDFVGGFVDILVHDDFHCFDCHFSDSLDSMIDSMIHSDWTSGNTSGYLTVDLTVDLIGSDSVDSIDFDDWLVDLVGN